MPANRFIPLYNSQYGAVPTASAMYDGELAVNISDGKLYTKSGSVIVALNDTTNFVSSSTQVVGLLVDTTIEPAIVKSNEFRLDAGTVNMIFTGSINTGIFGATEYVQPYISTTNYSGMTVEYLAQRPGACRMGIIMASWLNTGSITFTDVSTTDIGDTSDISFMFLSASNELRLRVNSAGSGSGAWTVQSLFKLFPNLNP
jgi:hypothetical protein